MLISPAVDPALIVTVAVGVLLLLMLVLASWPPGMRRARPRDGARVVPASRHRCEPPLVEQRLRVPTARATSRPAGPIASPAVTGAELVRRTPPPPRTTWRCPSCRRVHVVVAQPSRYRHGFAATRRVWRRAGWADRRRHVRLERGAR